MDSDLNVGDHVWTTAHPEGALLCDDGRPAYPTRCRLTVAPAPEAHNWGARFIAVSEQGQTYIFTHRHLYFDEGDALSHYIQEMVHIADQLLQDRDHVVVRLRQSQDRLELVQSIGIIHIVEVI